LLKFIEFLKTDYINEHVEGYFQKNYFE